MRTRMTSMQLDKTRLALKSLTGANSYYGLEQSVIDLIPREVMLNPKELWALASDLQDEFEQPYQLTSERMTDALSFVSGLSLPKAKLTPRRRALSVGMDALMNKSYRWTFSPHFYNMAATKLRTQIERLHLQPYTDANRASVVERGDEVRAIRAARRAALGLAYKPLPLNNYLGNCFTVELEFLAETDSALTQSGASKIFAAMTNPNVLFKGDCSVQRTSSLHERALYQEATISIKWGQYKTLYETCRVMTDAGATVNTSCGLHVHLDSRHLNRHQEMARRRKLRSALPWLFEMVPPSRKDNRYCWDNNNPRPPERRRYLAISPASYNKHGSTEIRLGAGSLDPDKILNWATLLKFLADSRLSYPTFERFLDSKAPHHIKVWAVLRRNKFLPALGNTTEGSESNV